jgi:co-chaperonin GroES (HSP10)
VIRPLGNRVLIKPDPRAIETASGLAIPDAHFEYDMSGIVVSAGMGPASAHRVREAMIARFHALIDDVCERWEPMVGKRLHEYLNAPPNADLSEIKAGDHVAFPYTAGTLIDIDGERHLLMTEDQIVAVLETP